MASASTPSRRQAALIPHLEPGFPMTVLSGETIPGQTFVSADATTGKAKAPSVNGTDIVGVNTTQSGRNNTGGDYITVGYGKTVVIADDVISAGTAIKCGGTGRAVQHVDTVLSGTTIGTTAAGGNFAIAGQPQNDGLEAVSSNAGDTTQSFTVYGTTTGTDTVVAETVALNGTTVVSTTKVDWGFILGIELSASCAGTLTFREASGDVTLITIATTVLQAGVTTISGGAAAYYVAPTAVAGGASTKVLGLIGTNAAGTTIYDSKALNGTTPVTFNLATFRRVTKILAGDNATATTTTVKVGAAESTTVKRGVALENSTAQGDRIAILFSL